MKNMPNNEKDEGHGTSKLGHLCLSHPLPCPTLSPLFPVLILSPSHPPSPPKKGEPKKGVQNIVYYKPCTPMDFVSGDKL